MVTNNRLDVFLNFRIDNNLPKFKQNNVIQSQNDSTITVANITGTNVSNRVWIPETRFINGTDSSNETDSNFLVKEFISNSVDYLDYLQKQINKSDISMFVKLKYNIFLTVLPFFLRTKKKKVVEEKTYNNINEFFHTLKGNKIELTNSDELLNTYENILINAKNNGQEALVDKLLSLKDIIVTEKILLENGISCYVTEQQVIELYRKVDKRKNLKLTWLKNYIRVIPDKAVECKNTADKLNIFDNYVILHFDPLNNQSELTKKEKEEKAKDPILFGVFTGSDKLYFIADWEDQFCDLTLEKMMSIINDKEKQITNETVISYIK